MKLSKRQTKALKKSIKKWEAIVAGTGIDDGADNCELCKKYIGCDCKSCPVCLTVSAKWCHNTPHEQWCDYTHRHLKNDLAQEGKVFGKKSKRLAQAELDFLKGILEESKDE